MKWTTTIGANMRELWKYRDEPEGLGRLADLHWRGLLFLAAFVVVCAVVYGAVKLIGVAGDNSDGTGVLVLPGSGFALDQEVLKATLEGFAARGAHY